MRFKIYTRFLVPLALVFFSFSQAFSQLQAKTISDIQLLLQEKESRSPAQRKMDSRLLQAAREKQGLKMVSGVNLEPVKMNAQKDGKVNVDISAEISDDLLSKIKTLGGTIVYASKEHHTVRASIDLANAETIAGYKGVKFIQPAAIAKTVGSGTPKNNINKKGTGASAVTFPSRSVNRTIVRNRFEKRAARVRAKLKEFLQHWGSGSAGAITGGGGTVISEGDRTHRADDARNTYGYEGQGIRIGVLSDSYNSTGSEADDVATGNLPGKGNPLGDTIPVTVLADITNGTDEGRAMLQIIHDLAPKAQLFFATAYNGEASFADNIVALRSAPYNCDIIVDDVAYSDEPAFQDGIVAQAVNTITASGGLYFSSAGNEGSLAKGTAGVWEGDFNGTGSDTTLTGSTKTGKLHNFGTVSNPVYSDSLLSTGSWYNLQWADPLGASSNDYDLFIVSKTGTVKASSTNIQSGTQDPYEEIDPATSSSFVTGDRLVVFKTASAAVRAISLNSAGGTLKNATTGQTHGHSAAAGAFSVAATPAKAAAGNTAAGPYPGPFVSTNQVEYFSSDGPRRVFFNADSTPVTPGNFLFGSNGGTVRAKPDITAADGVSTSMSYFTPFYGTSAAAPHAGAIAALLKSAKPSLTSSQIRTILTTTALDIETSGYDNNSGYGIVQAFQAMQALAPTSLSNISLDSLSATEGSFSNNNGVIDPGELGNIVVRLKNPSLANATGVTATLTTTTPGITVTQGSAAYGAISSSGTAINTLTPFTIGVNSGVPCGTVINFVLTVTFGGGGTSPKGFQFSIITGTQPYTNISSKLGSTPPSGAGFTAITGTQTGRINRSTTGVVSSCGVPRAAPGLAATTGARQFDAYTFTNTSNTSQCVSVTMSSPNADSFFTVVYNKSGFVPVKPDSNYLGDAGNSFSPQTFSFTAPAGQAFTIVIHAVQPGQAIGFPYNLNVSLTNCAAGPACSPVNITTASLATGATGTSYTQSFTATGGSSSGVYNFTIIGNLPAGLSFKGNTLSGTPTQAGSFPIRVVANDPAGCPGDTMTYTLKITGITPASITATAGTPQTTYPTTDFPVALKAIVKDSVGTPLPGVNVVFAAPDTGASGTFSGGLSTVTIVTDSNGVATAPTFTADTTSGSYLVTASVTGVADSAKFSLTNYCPSSFVVTSNADSGPGTLREIITNACPGITVTFDQSVTLINLTSGQLVIKKPITITGPGANLLTISAGNNSRVLYISPGSNTATVNISGLTFRDGKVPANSAYGGGGIMIDTGIVNVTGCVISNNDATAITTNYSDAGGLYNRSAGSVTIDHSSIINNITDRLGGGIAHWGSARMTITNSTISGNEATGLTSDAGLGGGLFYNYLTTLTNCTIYGNTAYLYGGNIEQNASTLTMGNTIVGGGVLSGAGSANGKDFDGGFNSTGYNIIQDTGATTISGSSTGNQYSVNPKLLPLGNYGGTTPTNLPMPNSPAINAGNPALTTGTDQRGLPRLVGSQADIGAVETNYMYAASAGTGQVTPVLTAFPLPLQAKVTESGNNIAGVSVFFAAPTIGASGTFANGSNRDTATTNASGVAAAHTFTANDTTGTYNDTASIGSAFATVTYTLTNSNALPLTFSSVTASASNCTIQIDWKTLTEINTKDFTVEYSTDGTNFSPLATLPAKGNSTSVQDYSYSHVSTADGINYYRIKQTDKNGDYTYSSVVIVTNSCGKQPIVAYPNPVTDKLTVILPGTQKRTLTIFDAAGRRITQISVSGGTHEINSSRWIKGIYTLSVTQQGQANYVLKIIKQ